MDNDIYGHVNNTVYLSWFDSVLNGTLIDRGLLQLKNPGIIGLMAESHCNYFDSVAYPLGAEIGLRVGRIGTSSVRYEMAAFGSSKDCIARGHLIHVYVDPDSRRPIALPSHWRITLEQLQ